MKEWEEGYTLIELLLVISVMGVLATMLASLFGMALRGYALLDRRKEMVCAAGGSLEEMTDCFGAAKWIEGALPLSETSEVTVACDVDADDVLEKVHYYHVKERKELRRKIDGVPADGALLAEGVEEATFSGGPGLVTISLRLSADGEEVRMQTCVRSGGL